VGVSIGVVVSPSRRKLTVYSISEAKRLVWRFTRVTCDGIGNEMQLVPLTPAQPLLMERPCLPSLEDENTNRSILPSP
jgi:hypothetical protein